jgi:AcrR family transcriptional regulator
MTYFILSKEEQLKEVAIQAAQKLFQRYGFQKTTMKT